MPPAGCRAVVREHGAQGALWPGANVLGAHAITPPWSLVQAGAPNHLISGFLFQICRFFDHMKIQIFFTFEDTKKKVGCQLSLLVRDIALLACEMSAIMW